MQCCAARNHHARTAFALHRFIHVGGDIVRTLLSALAIASLLGVATPALADSGPGGSLQRAILAARDFGVIGFSQIQYYDGKWEIEGRDPRGKTVNMNVDAITGAVLKVDRSD
jgi:peptidase YpeB-like protein